MKRHILALLLLTSCLALAAIDTTTHRQIPYAIPATAAMTGTAVAATAVTITVAAPTISGQRNVIDGVVWSYSAAPTGGHISVKDGSTVVFECDITAAGAGYLPVVRKGSPNGAMTVVLASGAGSVIGFCNVVRVWSE